MQSKKRILMIDDNVLQGRLVADIFDEEFSNIDFHVAHDGEEGLRHLKDQQSFPNQQSQLIILDLNLPGKNGMEILTEIKEAKTLCHIPVAIFSSSSSSEDVNKAFCKGAFAYLVKPVHYEDLVTKLRKLVEFCFEVSEVPAL